MFLTVALVWGFAEATLFFIVPDVLFTFLVLFNPSAAWWSCMFALVGALLGGWLMYRWGVKEPERAQRIVAAVPGISQGLIERERQSMQDKGLWAVLLGPLKGVPYKIYAICAHSCGISLNRFLWVSVPARLSRFVLSVLIAQSAFNYLIPGLSLMAKVSVLSAFWIVFYCWYFVKMRNFLR